eukprot:TRINITY_DN20138_c0_g1_i1.p1 TRINITY_DN20138_c0_g1~~TRINITY_DN20138_c0_g1_i1.p1  ORF type:complete len:541 (-),score=105.76 TRINITY_DN20138_c0_g1_i1:398-2020(-)
MAARLALFLLAGAAAIPLENQRPNILLIAVDDLRPQFGSVYNNSEVHTPHIDNFFLAGGGTAMQSAYVQIAVCGPSRASMLTGRRPDTTRVGVGAPGWCWCQRTACKNHSLFMTLPTWLRQEGGYSTEGNGKLFHPDACAGFGFVHADGDDPRGWAAGYTVEANTTQEQWGTIPGPHDPVFNRTMGVSWMESPLPDESTTDGILATDAIERLANLSSSGIGKPGGAPFFLSVGLHKPHLPHIVPKKYFDLYPLDTVSLAPNRFVPDGFREENWHADGNGELRSYNLNAGPEFTKDNFGFTRPLSEEFSRLQRRGYFAATSFLDAQVGRVLAALEANGYKENTIVLLWGDHGWHLGDTNSWGKMTNFESATHNTLLWRVPGQVDGSKGRSGRVVEAIDIFPTLLELAGVHAPPACTGVDAPPTVDCLQGLSYADLFRQGTVTTGKKYAFSQWPYPAWGPEKAFRMGYTVRTVDGYRFTEYVPYDHVSSFRGDWDDGSVHDVELYDYNSDPWETQSFAADSKYRSKVAELKAVLRAQYAPTV